MKITLSKIPFTKDSRSYASYAMNVFKALRTNLSNTTNTKQFINEINEINDMKLGDELEVIVEISVQKKKKR